MPRVLSADAHAHKLAVLKVLLLPQGGVDMVTRPDRLSVARENSQDRDGESIDPIKVLLVGDSKPSTSAMTRSLSDFGIEVMVAEDSTRARRFLSAYGNSVNAVLLDFDLPDRRCADLLPFVEALPRQPGIVILGTHPDGMQPETTSYRAVWAQTVTSPSALAKILRTAAQGYARCTLERFAKCFKLTDRESEILDRVANGVSPKQIATQLDCSIQAVYAHLAGMSRKTASANYQEVIAKLFQFSCHGLGHSGYE